MRDSLAPIHVLSIIEGSTVSGPARLLLDFCHYSQSTDLEPRAITSLATFVRGATKSHSNQLLDAAAAQGLKVHCIHERSAFDPHAISGLRQLSRELAPDIIETHGTKSHFLVRLSGVWRMFPWIAFHHGYTQDAKRTQLYNQFDRWSLRAPAAVVTVCEPFRWQLAKRGAQSSRITVLHNAISPDWLQGSGYCHAPPPAEALTGPHGVCTILAVGRLSKEKAYADLILAVNHLRRLHPDLPVRLLILGEGPEKPALEQSIRSLGLQDRVLLIGHVADARPYFTVADALAISSITEGEPMVLLEAMAAGVPVVATSVGGIPEILTDHQTGLLVAPRNPQAIAGALAELLADRALSRSMAEAALEQIKSRYLSEGRARSLLQLYERVYRSVQLQNREMGTAYERGA